MEIQLREISLADRLQYLESITANQESNKVTNPWTMVIACTIGGLIIGLVVYSILTHREKEKSQQNP
ncbi:MAG TPA: hypothetical protein PK328_03575 [Chitinophagaceae bacterium]|nr:hypothetical protein [Chitinophagaceae bacterium]